MKSVRPTRRRLPLSAGILLVLLASVALTGAGRMRSVAPPDVPVQPFQGPAAGTGEAGAIVSPSSVAQARTASVGMAVGGPREHDIPRVKNPSTLTAPLAPERSNEVDDVPNLSLRPSPGSGALAPSAPAVSFPGLDYTRLIPPDTIAAAGPNHVVAAVNSKFGAFTKSGTLLFQKDATSWFSNVLPEIASLGIGAFDPKVLYDSVAGRWLVVYLATDDKTESWVLVSVSGTSDPTGNWCNFALRGDRNGNTPSGNWSDYEGVGLDNQAVYITTNQFQMTPNADGKFQYARLRIIPKSQLYSCGSVTWYDFWDLRDPVSSNEQVFTVRPTLTYGSPGVEYLVNNSPFETGTYFTLWSLTDPLSGSPTLTAQNVPVTASTAPPNADQLGGSGAGTGCQAPCLIDTGDGRLLDAIYRNGSLWTSHAVAGGTNDAYARVRYVRMAVAGTPTVLEDVSFGADGCWYYYPAVAIDQSGNLAMVFSRSCTDSYVAARYTTRATTDSTLQGSTNLKSGEANYVNPTGGKNRWGDYSGASVDPADPSTVWLFGEYAASPANTWGTWGTQIAVTGGNVGPCVSGANTLCLNNSRFQVTVSFQSPAGSGSGTAVPLTSDTGYFWFFSANNVELVIKVVDGRAFNNRFWVFAGGLTNVNVVITVTDTQTGATQTYVNPQGVAFQPIQDTNAFASAKSPGTAESSARSVAAAAKAVSAGLAGLLERAPAGPAAPEAACVPNATTLCLNNNRFSVRTVWSAPGSGNGNGQAVALTGDTGYFWFFSPNNVEMVTKVVTGCGLNNRYWTFAGGLTNVNVVMTVTDTQTGVARVYVNPQGVAFQPVQDTSAFPCP
jgi:hypothetical protein